MGTKVRKKLGVDALADAAEVLTQLREIAVPLEACLAMHSTRQARRSFLRHLGTLAGVSLAVHACGAPSPRPSTAPVPTGPGSIDSLQHLVIACQENRTFDTYFGAYAKAGRFALPPGYAQPDGKGGRVRPQKLHLYDTKDIAHDWQTIHREWDHGKMDGFYLANGASALGYYDRSDLPYYYGLADAFTLCGNCFCYQLGPTLPNHIALWAGTSGGITQSQKLPPGSLDYPTILDLLEEHPR